LQLIINSKNSDAVASAIRAGLKHQVSEAAKSPKHEFQPNPNDSNFVIEFEKEERRRGWTPRDEK